MANNIAVFLDRDGTINEEVGYVDNLDKLKIIPAAYEAIRLINSSRMKAIVVTNQSGVAKGFFTEEFLNLVNDSLQTALRQKGAYIDNFYYCPHHPTEGIGIYLQQCNCRKPAPGMLFNAAQELNIDLTRSYLIGDRFRDMIAAKKAGVKGILVKTGYDQDLLQDDGPDKETAEAKPYFIAADILEAVKWILEDRE